LPFEKEFNMPRMNFIVLSILFFAMSISLGFAQSGIITTYMGPQLPVMGGSAVSQAMDSPASVIPEGAGGYYVICQFHNRVYRVDAGGKINLVAGNGIMGYSGDGRAAVSAQLNAPQGIALEGAGNLYIADTNNNRIRKVTPAGIISTVAGNGSAAYTGDGGAATEASLNNPMGIAVDSSGNLYIADRGNNRIRKVTSDGIIQTVAGNASYGWSGDGGLATESSLYDPRGVALDAAGNFYIADFYNSRIRKVTAAGIISTVAGNGLTGYTGDGGQAISAQIGNPWSVALDAAGNLYLSDNTNSQVRAIASDGVISTVTGTGTGGFSGDAGPATVAKLGKPRGIAIDSSRNLFIADTNNNRVRRVTVDGVINTVGGNGTLGFGGDGGQATAAATSYPRGMAFDSAGNLYIAEQANNRIRKVTPDGMVSTVAGYGTAGYSGDGGAATQAQLNNPDNVVVDSSGNLYIADGLNWRIRKVTPNGMITTVVGTGTMGNSGDGGAAIAAQIGWVEGMAFDSAGNFYFSNYRYHRVRKVNTSGIISTVAGNGTKGYSGDGGSATAAMLSLPSGLAVDSDGSIYIGDAGNLVIRKVTGGIIRTVAGNGATGYSGDGGPATAAALNSGPAANATFGLAIDSAGNLLLADPGNCVVRKVTPAGIIDTIAGNGIAGFSGDSGIATAAQMLYPSAIGLDSAGSLFISDQILHRIRKVTNILDCSSLSLRAGGVAACRTAGANTTTRDGYAILAVNSGAVPYGTAVFSYKQSGVTLTEAGVPASPPTTKVRIFVDYRKSVTAIPGRSESGAIDINTGLSVVNQGAATANVAYSLRALNGNVLATGHGTIARGGHIASFVDQLKQMTGDDFGLPYGFEQNTQFGTLELASDQPLSVIALRMTTNQRNEPLFTTTPVADMNQAPAGIPIYFAQFADGGGYTTSLVLLNTSGQAETGSLQIFDKNGVALVVNQAGGSPNSTFQYSIPAGGAFRFQSDGLPGSANVGWAQIVPDAGSMTPVGSGVFSYNRDEVLVSESGIPSSVSTTHARVYVDRSGGHNVGLAIANIGGTAASITVNSYQTDGASGVGTSWGTLTLVPYGQDAKFADQLIEGLPAGYRGVLDISSATPFAALTVRSLTNERSDFLMTTFPVADSNQTAPSPVVFPHLADGGGYVTEFILISGSSAANTTPGFYDDSGSPADFSK
jgi:trimeric autotransporter adhesin